MFSGSHPRHLFINQIFTKFFDEILVFVVEREDQMIPIPPTDINDHDKKLFINHFAERDRIEKKNFGSISAGDAFNGCKIIKIARKNLNTNTVSKIVKDFNADFCFIFGTNIIRSPVIDVLPDSKINLHLGLSPWYRGGATLFWPFYHLKPQFSGVTFHQINESPDAGEIIHQSCPNFESLDGIHDIGAKCIIQAADDIHKMMKFWLKNKEFKGKVQKTTGRVWRTSDFHASHLRVIYDLYSNKIVDHYLKGNLSNERPLLYSCLEDV